MEEETKFHICELEQGPILGEKEDEVDEKYNESRWSAQINKEKRLKKHLLGSYNHR